MAPSSALLRARMAESIYGIWHKKDYVIDMSSKTLEASSLQWHS